MLTYDTGAAVSSEEATPHSRSEEVPGNGGQAVPSREALQEQAYCLPYHHLATWTDEVFQHYHVYPSAFEYASYCRLLIERIAAMAVASVLDIGCGDGRLCLAMHKALPQARLRGVDISERAIAFARLLVSGCDFFCGDLSDPELIGETFEAATLVEVLEHIEPSRVPAFLEAVRQRLRPDGRLLVTVPSSVVPVAAKHYRHFDEGLLRQVLSPHFEVEEVVFLNRTGRRAGILYRLMSNKVFILANPRLLGWLLRYYERTSLLAGPDNCSRLLAVCRNRTTTAATD